MDKLFRLSFTLLSWMVILFALATIGLRISLANIDYFKPEIENWFASEVITGASFVSLKGDWDQFNPVLHLTRASITLPNKTQALVIDEIVVELDYFRSLWHRTPVVAEVTGELRKLSLRKDSEQQWWLNDIPLAYSGSGQTVSNFEELIELFPHYIQLELGELEISDESSETKYRINQLRVDMQQRNETIHWKLSANLPASLGGRLDLRSIVRQDNSLVYLKSNSVQLSRVADLFDINVGDLHSAELSGELWINLINNEDPVLNGDISVTRGLWNAVPGESPLPFSLSASVSGWSGEKQWNLGVNFESLSIDNQTLHGFNTQLRVTEDDGQKFVQGWVEDFELHNMVLLHQALLTVEIAELLEQSQVQGRLKNAWFSFDLMDAGNIEVSANVTDLSSRPVGSIPGIEGLNASFTFGRGNAAVQLNGNQISLDFVDIFRAPLEIDQLQLQANVSLMNEALVVSVSQFEGGNTDLRLAGRMQLETDPAGAPFLYLRAQFEDGRGSSNGKYLPLNLLPEEVVAWLDKGIRKVDISAGDFLFHGRVDAVTTFDTAYAGEMVAEFDIDNAEILFDLDWVAAREIGGRVFFHNSSMDIAVDRVKYDQVESGQGSVSIRDLTDAVVEVDIETNTTADSALKTWFRVPIAQNQAFLGKYLHDVEGSVRANLHLEIPVNERVGENRVDVNLKLDRASVTAPDWGVSLSEINGEVRVTDKGVSGQGIQAKYFKDPIVVDISNTAENRQTIVLAKGEIESRMVLNRLPDFIDQKFEGRSPWQIRLAIDNQKDSQQQPVVHLRATSDLKNTAVLFPEPLVKQPEVARDLYAELAIYELDNMTFKFSYGREIKAQGRLQTDKQGGYGLAAMDLGFSTELKEPITHGLRIYGSLQKLPLDDWILLQKSIQADQSDDADSLYDLLESTDLEVQSVSFFGRESLNTSFHLTRTPQGFDGKIDSSLIKGDFKIPFSYSEVNPVTVDLEYLKFRSLDTESESTGLQPHDLFNIQLRSKLFEYNNVSFTRLVLDAQLVKDTLIIDTMSLQRNDLSLNLNANWQYTPGVNEHFTTLNMSIKGKEFGQTIAGLELGDIMHDGEIDIEGRAGWSGELLTIDWGSLIGEAKFVVLDGVLKDVQPGGSGRLVGLLSLNALPRRLMLDFGDVFIDGLKFDELKGNFKIEQGNLYTSNTRLDAPSVRIKVSGRTGLLHRDYDQKMIIIPKIGNTLPVITALTWGNAVGWAVLLVKSLIKKQIDKTVEIEYKVTGTWEEPVLEKVREFKEDKPRKILEGGNR